MGVSCKHAVPTLCLLLASCLAEPTPVTPRSDATADADAPAVDIAHPPDPPPCPPAAPARWQPDELVPPGRGLVPWLASRIPDVPIPTAPARVGAWQAATRATLLSALGFDRIEPPGAPVAALALGDHALGDAVAGRWLVEAHSGTWIPTLLLRPVVAPPGPRPGVLVLHGHIKPGKTRTTILTLGVTLARRGCVVAIPDWPGYGDLDDEAWSHLHGEGTLLAGASMNIPVTTIPRRVLDWLASQPGVDPARLGVVGHSGGAESTMYIAAADPRVAAAVIVDGVDDWPWRMDHDLVRDPEHYPVGLIPRASYAAVLALVAPRWLCVVSGDADFVAAPSRVIAQVVERARAAFEAHGVPHRLRHVPDPSGHNLGAKKRLAVYALFADAFGDQTLAGKEDGVTWGDEPGLHMAPPQSGTTLDIVRALLDEALDSRPTPSSEAMRRILSWPEEEAPVTWTDAGKPTHTDRTGGLIERPDGPPLPADLVQPATPRGVVVCFADAGRADCAALADQLAATDLAVVAVDLRGQGELQGDWPYDSPLQRLRLANFSVALGDPLPDQQVRDVRAACTAARARIGSRLPQCAVIGLGPRAGLIAVLAGTVDRTLGPIVAPGAELDLRARWDSPTGVAPAESYPYGLFTVIDGPELPTLLGDRARLVGVPWEGSASDRDAVCEALRGP